jgi:tetratricopeptide (TPR) repeat protein
VARRGAGNVTDPGTPPPGSASAAWRKAVQGDRDRGRPGPYEPDTWVDQGPVRAEASAAVRRGARPGRAPRTLAPDVGAEVARAAGPAWAGRVADRLAEAAQAYEAERYRDARRILEGLLERAPSSIAVRELYGLTLYRLGRWRDAVRELGAVETLTGSVDHHPVIADAQRALGNRAKVRELWDELRRAGASVDVVIEGRIVLAGSLADEGRLPEAIAVLEEGPVQVRRPQAHHLRLWYALANLYERAGDPVRARGLFGRLVAADPGFADAADRLASLGG